MVRTLGLPVFSFLFALSSPTLASPSQVRKSDGPNEEPEARVLVYKYADISPDVLAGAERRATIIFQEIGVRVVWVDSAEFKKQLQNRLDSQEEQEKLDLIDVVLRIVPYSRTALKNSALGEALSCQLGRDACIANLFMNRVAEQTDVEKIGLDQVLGHAIAHEIGHILLGSNSHGSRGLMKAKWGPEDIKRMGKGDLLFTPEQAQVIQNNLAKLVRIYSSKKQ